MPRLFAATSSISCPTARSRRWRRFSIACSTSLGARRPDEPPVRCANGHGRWGAVPGLSGGSPAPKEEPAAPAQERGGLGQGTRPSAGGGGGRSRLPAGRDRRFLYGPGCQDPSWLAAPGYCGQLAVVGLLDRLVVSRVGTGGPRRAHAGLEQRPAQRLGTLP